MCFNFHAAGVDGNDKCVKRAPACDVGGPALPAVTIRRCVKDKRNLREKRRSTGVASYNSTSNGQVVFRWFHLRDC